MLFTVLVLGISNVSAATGQWYSAWGYDANGLSVVGTQNDMSYAVEFRLTVVRGSWDIIGTKTTWINPGKSDSHYTWGQPFLDRLGIVTPLSPYTNASHSPWFDS